MGHGLGLVNQALIALRVLHFATLMTAFGMLAFRCYGIAGTPPDATGALARFDRWLLRGVLAAAFTALATGLLMVPTVAAMMAGSAAASVDAAILRTVVFDTAFGRMWCWHLACVALLVAAVAAHRRLPAGLVLALAGASLASLALVGHMAERRNLLGLAQLNQAVHLLAAGAWLGGLLPLGRLLRRAAGEDDPTLVRLARDAVPPFSQMGYAAVALIALTGAVNTLILVGSIGALFATDYGRLLTLKIALYLAMVAIAAINRFRFGQRLLRSPGPDAASKLHRSVLIEQAVGGGILIAVGLLGTWPPAR